jgi:hypothetical protein
MRTTQFCPKCGGLELWNVRSMRERRFIGYGEMGYVDDVEPLETLVCKGCGFTAWYSDAFARLREDPGRVRHIVDDRLRCVECDGQSHFLVAQLREWPEESPVGAVPLGVLRTPGDEAIGRFAVQVCGTCGRCEWFAWGLTDEEAPKPVNEGKRDPEACVRCRTLGRRRVRPLLEDGRFKLPVAAKGDQAVGHFELLFCVACGYCEWYARSIERLQADGKTVIHVRGEPRRLRPTAGGPYR